MVQQPMLLASSSFISTLPTCPVLLVVEGRDVSATLGSYSKQHHYSVILHTLAGFGLKTLLINFRIPQQASHTGWAAFVQDPPHSVAFLCSQAALALDAPHSVTYLNSPAPFALDHSQMAR